MDPAYVYPHQSWHWQEVPAFVHATAWYSTGTYLHHAGTCGEDEVVVLVTDTVVIVVVVVDVVVVVVVVKLPRSDPDVSAHKAGRRPMSARAAAAVTQGII